MPRYTLEFRNKAELIALLAFVTNASKGTFLESVYQSTLDAATALPADKPARVIMPRQVSHELTRQAQRELKQ